MKILGIETSCDETALALFDNEKLLYSKVSSHIIHKNYGGVVPELASREHDKILPQLFKDCFRNLDISSDELHSYFQMPKRFYWDYPNDYKRIKLGAKILNKFGSELTLKR